MLCGPRCRKGDVPVSFLASDVSLTVAAYSQSSHGNNLVSLFLTLHKGTSQIELGAHLLVWLQLDLEQHCNSPISK
jgi:hypothetical protein